MYVYLNLNPITRTDDCAVRAISLAFNQSWQKTYMDLSLQGVEMYKMPNEKSVVAEYLKNKGYHRNTACPECYTVREFTYDHPTGIYILGLLDHIVTVIDGDYYDTWDSGDETVVYFWSKED